VHSFNYEMAIEEERAQFTAAEESNGFPPIDETTTTTEAAAEGDSSVSSTPIKSTPTKSAPTKLYVGNLSMKTNGNDLRRLFEKFGRVSDVDVVGNFAFVVMPNEAEAEEAIKALHDIKVDDKKLVVEKKKHTRRPASATARRGSDLPSGLGRAHHSRDIQLFVARVKDLSEEKLKEVFGKYGDVANVQKPKTKPDIAFVSMENFFEARKAVESLNKKVVEGLSRSIFVQLATNNVTRDGRPLQALLERGETIKLFVGNLDKEVTDSKALGVLFERYGPVFDVAIIKDKGFGFVHMLSRESAEDAVRGLNRRDFKGNPLSVTFSTKKGMMIGNGSGRPTPGSSSIGGGLAVVPGVDGGRLGARSMMPRGMMMARANNDVDRDPHHLPPPADSPFVDPLLVLQRQIQAQLLANRTIGGFDALANRGNDASPFTQHDMMLEFLRSTQLGGAPAAAHPMHPRDSVVFPMEDRSRYANFMGRSSGMRSPPMKRNRSPLSQLRSSPSPKKRNFMDEANNAGRSPSRDGQMNAPDSGMRRNAAKSVPPKMFHQRIF